MSHTATMVFLTTPHQTLPSRRRDPLGFTALAGEFADMLAPGLTNRTREPRWLAILCWSLMQARRDFPELEGKALYEPIRGLELRWVQLTCEARPGDGIGLQLPGSRAVRKAMKRSGTTVREFMSDDQWRRYRYLGPWASYRSLMVHLGLVDVSGWNLTGSGLRLAGLVHQVAATGLIDGTKRTAKDEENGYVSYWQRRWKIEPKALRDFLPQAQPALTPPVEKLLCPLMFQDSEAGRRRLAVAQALGRARDDEHAALCEDVQRDLLTHGGDWTDRERAHLQGLGLFARFADAGVNALRAVWERVQEDRSGKCSVNDAAAAAKPELEELRQACSRAEWMKSSLPEEVLELRRALVASRSNAALLRVLIRHHQTKAGGLRWLRLHGEYLDRSARHEQSPQSDYRFRLGPLARLACGCRILDALPAVFGAEPITDEENNDEE